MRLFTFCFSILFFILSSQLVATTIRPYANLGEMAKACDLVIEGQVVRAYSLIENGQTRFRFSLRVLEPIKGDIERNAKIDIQNYHIKVGELERIVWGDLELEEGKTYLLFLSRLQEDVWQASMLSYAAFELNELQGMQVFQPFSLGNEVHIDNQHNQIEPLDIYRAKELKAMLKEVVGGRAQWNKDKLVSYDMQEWSHHQRGAEPSHCTFLSSEPWARWQDLASTNLPVRYHTGGDAGCASAPSRIASAISQMNSMYPGVNLSNAGTHNFNPSCSGEGATDDEFTTYVNTQLGGNRHLLIQFDDPCNEIPNLSGCSGTYAFGGLYWFGSQHTFNGMNWRNAAYGYVVVNNGAGACSCSGDDYIELMIHEMSHSLNIGHIAASEGAANMNPSGSSGITSLDQECLAFSYADGALPVELTDFAGWAETDVISLLWETASESENDFYTVEKRMANGSYEAIGNIRGAGTSLEENQYDFSDLDPTIGDNHYRLLQTDFDGSVQMLQSIVVPFYIPLAVSIFPNPMTGHVLNAQVKNDKVAPITYRVFDWVGRPIFEQRNESIRGIEDIQFVLTNISSGVYFLKVSQGSTIQTLRFIKV